MPEIRHQFRIVAPAETITAALTETDRLRAWFTASVEGAAAEGGALTFRFASGAFNRMWVEAHDPGRRVTWECMGGAEDWVGTRVDFRLEPGSGATAVQFSHGGFEEWTHATSTYNFDWALHLSSLRQYCEEGRGHPDPGPAEARGGGRS